MKYCFQVYATDISQDEINCVLSKTCLGKFQSGFLCEVTVNPNKSDLCLLELTLSLHLMCWLELLHHFIQILQY